MVGTTLKLITTSQDNKAMVPVPRLSPWLESRVAKRQTPGNDLERLLGTEPYEEHVWGKDWGQLYGVAGTRCVVEVAITRVDAIVA